MKTKRKDRRASSPLIQRAARLTGEETKALQKALEELGFPVSDNPGTLGPPTRQAKGWR
jgi:5'-3' exonuclease